MATEDEAKPKPATSGKKKTGILLLAGLLVVGVGAAFGGVLVARSMLQKAQAQGEPTTQPAGAATAAQPAAAAPDQEYRYYDIEPIIVNLDEPRMARYVRVAAILAFRAEDHGHAQKTLDQRKPELKNLLTEVLVGCTVEDVRGKQNFNRLQREIQDKFNDRFWPEKPLIHHVIFKEFAVQ